MSKRSDLDKAIQTINELKVSAENDSTTLGKELSVARKQIAQLADTHTTDNSGKFILSMDRNLASYELCMAAEYIHHKLATPDISYMSANEKKWFIDHLIEAKKHLIDVFGSR